MCFSFFRAILSATFLIIVRSERDMIKMHIDLHVMYPLFLSGFNEPWIFSTNFRKMLKYKISWKSVGDELFHAEGGTDGQTGRQTWRSIAKSPKNFLLLFLLQTSLNWPYRSRPYYTGRFIMFSVIRNVYNKKTKGPTLMELFTATGKLKKFLFWQLEIFGVCTTHASISCWHVCGKNLNIVSMCAVSHVVHTSNISSCQKKPFSVFLWLWTIPLRYVLWFSCYKCL